jgi:hypothetical protein
MRVIDIIQESEGGLIRRGQEVSQGKTVTFAKGDTSLNLVGTIVIPETETHYEEQAALAEALKATLEANGNPTVLYSGKIPKGGGAALITIFKDSKEQQFAFVKFANKKKPGAFPIQWSNADFGRETGFLQANNAIAQRAQFNIKPNTLFQTGVDLDVLSLPESVQPQKNPAITPEIAQQIQQMLANVASGNKTPVPGAAQYASTYEIDLGESAAPIALYTGNFVSGSYAEAERVLLQPLGLTWKSLNTVEFPGAGSNLLYDSYMHLSKNSTLKISSKDKKGGAAASVTGLIKDISDNPERFKEVTDNKQFQEILTLINTVAAETAVKGPLSLAERLGFISADDVNNIIQNYGQGLKYNRYDWTQTPGIQAALNRKGAKFEDPAYDMSYHILAGIAELVADHLNALPGVSDFFKAVLTRSTMIQVKTSTVKSGDGAAFSNFNVIYPPVFNGIIKVVAGNNYMATRRPIGKISFKI